MPFYFLHKCLEDPPLLPYTMLKLGEWIQGMCSMILGILLWQHVGSFGSFWLDIDKKMASIPEKWVYK